MPDGSVAKPQRGQKMRREWTDGAFNKLTLYEDKPGNYDAWDVPVQRQAVLTWRSRWLLIEQDGRRHF